MYKLWLVAVVAPFSSSDAASTDLLQPSGSSGFSLVRQLETLASRRAEL